MSEGDFSNRGSTGIHWAMGHRLLNWMWPLLVVALIAAACSSGSTTATDMSAHLDQTLGSPVTPFGTLATISSLLSESPAPKRT